ncbi:hypothetical protein HY988_03810 [Candidatus Micrarchaeota archaeon]|nr:hypothetical protein [Candidatus Micrarchaeota archaeon]
MIGILVSVPLQMFFGEFAGYNILFLLYMILGSFCAYKFLEYLTKEREISFVLGFFYGVSPYIFMQSIEYNLLPVFTIPLTFYYFLRYLDSKGAECNYAFFLSLTLMVFSTIYYFLFSILLLLSIAFYYYKDKYRCNFEILKSLFFRSLPGASIFLFLSTLYLFPHITQGGNYGIGAGEITQYSSDLASFVVPSLLHPLWGDITLGFYEMILAQEYENPWAATSYIGIILIFSILYILWHYATQPINFIDVFIYNFGFYFALMLGPVLKVNGIITDIPLPFSVFYYSPIFTIFHVMSRFYVMFFLIALLLTALLFKELKTRFFKNQMKKFSLVLVVLFAILLVDLYSVPIFMKTPDSNLSQLFRRDGIVLDVPLSYQPIIFKYALLHKKPIIDGYVSHTLDTRAFVREIAIDPIMGRFMLPYVRGDALMMCIEKNSFEGLNLSDTDLAKAVKNRFSYYNISYIIFYKSMEQNESFFLANFNQLYTDEEVSIYEVQKST